MTDPTGTGRRARAHSAGAAICDAERHRIRLVGPWYTSSQSCNVAIKNISSKVRRQADAGTAWCSIFHDAWFCTRKTSHTTV